MREPGPTGPPPRASSAEPLTIAWCTLGIASYRNRTLPILTEARARGHRVVLLTADEQTARIVAEAGHEVVDLVDQRRRWEQTLPGTWWPRGGRILAHVPGVGEGPRGPATAIARARREVLLDTVELLDALAAIGPDLVVTEAEQHRDIRAVLGAGHPLALVDDLYGTTPGPGAPHAGSAVLPGTGVGARAGAAASWTVLRARLAGRAAVQRWWLHGADPASVRAELASEAGLPPGAVSDGGYHFHTYPGVPVIRPIASELLAAGDDRGGLVTGPVVDPLRHERPMEPVDQQRLDEVLSRCATAHRMLVILTTGTLAHGQDRLVRITVAALGDRPDVEVILALGLDADSWRDRIDEANFHVFAEVPMLRLLRQASLVIGHGGVATAHEALWFGVPQVLVPCGGIGQHGLAARLQVAGVGIRVHPRMLSRRRLGRAVDAALGDAALQRRVDAVSHTIRARDGVRITMDAIESIARRQ